MKRTCFLLAAGVMCQVMVPAQVQRGGSAFQAADTLAAGGRGGRGNPAPLPRAEAGKPFSATAVTQTNQTLQDGTRVSQKTTVVQYRDSEGRVRTESSEAGGVGSEAVKVITIRDPVAGASYRLDAGKRTAVRTAMAAQQGQEPKTYKIGRGDVLGIMVFGQPDLQRAVTVRPDGMITPRLIPDLLVEGLTPEQVAAKLTEAYLKLIREPVVTVSVEKVGTGGGRGRGVGAGAGSNARSVETALAELVKAEARMREAAAKGRNNIVEDLGTMTVNGVAARGTRTTTVVPVGAIGNDREFRSVSERWFSTELNLLVKSVNTDPRFGTTTYELTNISRQAPGASLFQVPGDYSVTSGPILTIRERLAPGKDELK